MGRTARGRRIHLSGQVAAAYIALGVSVIADFSAYPSHDAPVNDAQQLLYQSLQVKTKQFDVVLNHKFKQCQIVGSTPCDYEPPKFISI